MFLNSNHIESTYLKESFGPTGQREKVLVVHMDSELQSRNDANAKQYEHISSNLAYLNSLAGQGFLEFDRIEVVSPNKIN